MSMKRMGRPRKKRENRKSIQVGLRFTPFEYTKIRQSMRDNNFDDQSFYFRTALMKAFGI